MLKKLLTALLLIAFCASLTPYYALAAKLEQTPLEKVAAAEKLLYGSEQEGSLLERTGKLEKELFGLPGKEALMAKVDRIYLYVRESTATSPSMAFKISALEWSLSQSMGHGPLKSRLETLERTVAGVGGSGSLDSRLIRLMTLTFPASKFQTGSLSLSKDTLIKIKTVTPLDTRKNKTGDPVEFEVAEDVYVAGLLAIARGARGTGRIAKAEPAQNFGRDAKLEVNFENVEALDMTQVGTLLGDKAKEETKSMATAAGAGVAGMILLGPIGVVGAAFVHGKNVSVPAGSQLYIQSQNDVELIGLAAK